MGKDEAGFARCGVCGARYTVYNSTYYGCSFHINRGNTICANGKVVHRDRLEKRLLEAIQQEVFTPNTIAYLTERVKEQLKRLLRQQQTKADRHSLEQALAQALKEREYIKDAIRRGLVGEITREMLDEVETRIRDLQARLKRLVPPIDVVAGIALPQAIQTRLQDLGKVLGRDVERARGLLRDLLGEIVLRPTVGGLVAELRGNVEGLLDLEKALPAGLTGNSGSGGRI